MVSLADQLIPDSSGDFLAIIVWVLIVIFVIIVGVDLFMFLSYRKSSQKREKPSQVMNHVEPTPLITVDRLPEINDIGTKVDQLLEAHKL